VIVVADTSVLLNLCRVQQLDLLRSLFGEVIIPPEVGIEFATLSLTSARFQGLALPIWIRQQTATMRIQIPSASDLHTGEIAALTLAIEIRADAVLIDERSGHAAARQLGIKTIGILGILLEAKAKGQLSSIRPVIDRLENEANFWIARPLRDHVLQLAGE
jgi:hypothetical protein